MKKFTITITGECPDGVPDEFIEFMAGTAEVQILEPEIPNPEDAANWNPLEFDTRNVQTVTVIE